MMRATTIALVNQWVPIGDARPSAGFPFSGSQHPALKPPPFFRDPLHIEALAPELASLELERTPQVQVVQAI